MTKENIVFLYMSQCDLSYSKGSANERKGKKKMEKAIPSPPLQGGAGASLHEKETEKGSLYARFFLTLHKFKKQRQKEHEKEYEKNNDILPDAARSYRRGIM